MNSVDGITSDPERACIFVYRARTLLEYNGGHESYTTWRDATLDGSNHVLVDVRDENTWKDGLMSRMSKAMLAKTYSSPPGFRPGFDIAFPLWPIKALPIMEPGSPRKYRATFKGSFYAPGTHGWYRQTLADLHEPGTGIVVVAKCNIDPYDPMLLYNKEGQIIGGRCAAAEKDFDEYSYDELMNTTFAFVPGGKQPSSYRLLEAMRVGTVPILITNKEDKYTLPFSQVICWSHCAVNVPIPATYYDESRIDLDHEHWIKDLRQVLVRMPEEEIVARQRSCRAMYENHFASSKHIALALRDSIKAIVGGGVDPCAKGRLTL